MIYVLCLDYEGRFFDFYCDDYGVVLCDICVIVSYRYCLSVKICYEVVIVCKEEINIFIENLKY